MSVLRLFSTTINKTANKLRAALSQASSALSHHLPEKKLQPCSCRQLQPFAFQHLRARPSESCMCEVSAAPNVQKHVYAVLFVCRNRLNDRWVEVAGDLSALIRNLWSAKMLGLQGGGIGSCRTGRQATGGESPQQRENTDCGCSRDSWNIYRTGLTVPAQSTTNDINSWGPSSPFFSAWTLPPTGNVFIIMHCEYDWLYKTNIYLHLMSHFEYHDTFWWHIKDKSVTVKQHITKQLALMENDTFHFDKPPAPSVFYFNLPTPTFNLILALNCIFLIRQCGCIGVDDKYKKYSFQQC